MEGKNKRIHDTFPLQYRRLSYNKTIGSAGYFVIENLVAKMNIGLYSFLCCVEDYIS